ncbi:hypothetical protein ACFL35_07255 [Candidatus Riflebacteria bacterium]
MAYNPYDPGEELGDDFGGWLSAGFGFLLGSLKLLFSFKKPEDMSLFDFIMAKVGILAMLVFGLAMVGLGVMVFLAKINAL